jgi:hypothetical protein
MDGCIQGELHDDDQKAATALQASSEVSVKMWVEFGFMRKGLGPKIF